MKRTLTIIAIVITVLMVIVGLTLWIPNWLGDSLWDYDEPTWVG